MTLKGDLIDLPLLDILHIFQRDERHGRLSLLKGRERAVIWFQAGQVTNALLISDDSQQPPRVGEEALFALARWPHGSFRFMPLIADDHDRITITRPTMQLIVEILQQRAQDSLPHLPPGMTMETALRAPLQMVDLATQIDLSPIERTILDILRQQHTPAQIVEHTHLTPEQVVCAIARLIDLGLVATVTLADLPDQKLVAPVPVRTKQNATSKLVQAIKRRLQQLHAA